VSDFDQHVLGIPFGIFDKNIEIAVVVKNAGIQKFVFQFVPTAVAIGDDQILIGISRLWIFVEVFHVGMGGRTVEVKVILLHVLAMIALAVGQAEQPLLENRVVAIP
jgi:hypothetical protein